ncbi:hypothetical protein ACKS0A_10450 [Histoplasma ohiense]
MAMLPCIAARRSFLLARLLRPVCVSHSQPSLSHIQVKNPRSSLSLGTTDFHSGTNPSGASAPSQSLAKPLSSSRQNILQLSRAYEPRPGR